MILNNKLLCPVTCMFSELLLSLPFEVFIATPKLKNVALFSTKTHFRHDLCFNAISLTYSLADFTQKLT